MRMFMATMLATTFAATLTAGALVSGSAAIAQQKPAPEGASVYFVSPEEGATVSSPVRVVFGLTGMGIAPAGVEKAATGHHHLIIDVDPESLDLSGALPADENVVHFGGGQTETEIDLAPGEHTLYLLLGDENHIPFDPPILSEPLTITVE
ncbi:DUF4399 domain-containing protein [Amaricoccus macauensis]|uniref:DUF4399 domain-containing protein n=1 Tax=Amaricoccus macauensis TaxID=57001 RepID=UPI003C7AC5B2